MGAILEQTRRHDRKVEAVVASFTTRAGAVLARAQARVTTDLRTKLSLSPEDLVLPTAGNMRVIRALPTIFRQAMLAEGYRPLVATFVNEFDGQLQIFDKILQEISRGFKVQVEFTQRDFDFFRGFKVSTGASLLEVVDQTAQVARTQAMFSMNASPFQKMAVQLADRLHTTLPRAETLAATGISTFYRTVADRGYQIVEKELEDNDEELEFTYVGPPAGDRLIRPFCKKLMAAAASGQTWTRGQIDKMNNGQLPNVFTTCGGYNCRHQWVVALEGDTI